MHTPKYLSSLSLSLSSHSIPWPPCLFSTLLRSVCRLPLFSSLLFSFLSTAEAIKMLFPYYCPKFNRLLWQQQQQHHSTWNPGLKMWQTDWLTNWLTGRRMCDNIMYGGNGEPSCMLCVPDIDKATHISMAYISLSRGHVIFSHWIHCKKGLRRAHIQK